MSKLEPLEFPDRFQVTRFLPAAAVFGGGQGSLVVAAKGMCVRQMTSRNSA